MSGRHEAESRVFNFEWVRLRNLLLAQRNAKKRRRRVLLGRYTVGCPTQQETSFYQWMVGQLGNRILFPFCRIPILIPIPSSSSSSSLHPLTACRPLLGAVPSQHSQKAHKFHLVRNGNMTESCYVVEHGRLLLIIAIPSHLRWQRDMDHKWCSFLMGVLEDVLLSKVDEIFCLGLTIDYQVHCLQFRIQSKLS